MPGTSDTVEGGGDVDERYSRGKYGCRGRVI